ncbi:MAG: amylo-alpha-1,6-glucosidase [Actinobacteria bacterium]|nr:amylo-alpha-1,6-glucosidase [Actinomycetota bacterium]
MRKIVSPEGEEFYVEVEATNRILNEGIPFIIVDIRERRLAIKEGDYFLFTNSEGNIPSNNTSGLGLYHKDTRFLSNFEFMVNGRTPILLSSTAERDYLAHIELTNADFRDGKRLIIPQETLNVRRLRVISGGLHERIRIKNYNPFPVDLELAFAFDADFADIFEVRGMRRQKRGKLLYPKLIENELIFAYLGEDDIFRQTKINLPFKPDSIETVLNRTIIRHRITIEPGGRQVFNYNVLPIIGSSEAKTVVFNAAVADLRSSYAAWEDQITGIFTDNELFNSVMNRGISDIRALVANHPEGRIFHAGLPWYVAPFGRDSLTTAIQVLSLTTKPAKETLRFLAKFQGKEVNYWKDEEPGKILHEIREGELATLKEIPHTPYYGTVDATPLFLILAAEYYKWTNDLEFMREIRPNIELCLYWIDNYGDVDGDLFIEYKRHSKRGLINQGWKDSWNAVAHADGQLAEPPIALCEVQGYLYRAKMDIARYYRDIGEDERAQELECQASELKDKFNETFWLSEEGFFAMALDGNKKQVATVTSNVGQCLFSGIIDESKAGQVVNRLMQPDMFSGWGIRTVSKAAKIYNPMSYHNGSVWPHDNSMIIYGVKAYGFNEEATILASALFDAAIHHTYYRLPELFCGFTRRGANWPVSYPVSCSPQAWAAGSVFLMLQAMLGIFPDASKNIVYAKNPVLPRWLNRVELDNLQVGDSKVSILLRREGAFTEVSKLSSTGNIKVVSE